MDIRFQPGQTLQVTLLTSNESTHGRIIQLNGRVATIGVDRPLAFGSPLRLDFDDCMLLGEVAACESAADDYYVNVEVQDAIPRMSNLARLVSAVMGGGRRTSDVETPVGSRC